ncbi:hypothetical protein C8R47DRAFT_1077928 [Mycena vitilis]|nr:hypothetical protein C8R47DRAFT_1077928 [Mycena vitilis]
MTTYQGGLFKIPAPAKARPRNPLRAATYANSTEKGSTSSMNVDEAQSLTSSDVQRVEQKEDTHLLRRLVRTDQFSFMSGSSDAAQQACHILNAIRTSKRGVDRAAIKRFKDSIESFATDLWFNHGLAFKLDVLVDEHYRWDVYGIYAFSPSYGELNLILDALRQYNWDWARRAASDAAARRDLPDSFSTASYTWRVVLLHPEDFMPRQQHVKVLQPDKRFLRISSEIPAEQLSSDWVDCRVQELPGEPPLLVHGTPPTPLSLQLSLQLRNKEERLSLFALLVNLHWKLEAYIRESKSSNSMLKLMYDTTTALMVEIFFRPPQSTISLPLPLPEKAKSPRHISTSRTASSSTNFSAVTPTSGTFAAGSGTNNDTSMESPDSSPVPHDPMNWPEVPTEPMDSPESLPVPPEPVLVNGLTSTECETLYDRLSQSTDGADSATAFMQLVCGPQGIPTFKTPATRWMREHGWESESGSGSGFESESESEESDAESVGA